jgi:DNA repair protein RecN (Recombination protein N)
MLSSIHISNYAIIDELHLEFGRGLTIITGETGAGKSIILGALSLVLGKRADVTVLKNKEKKCIVEAEFNISDYPLKDFFTENDLDFVPDTILRREISASGKSRAFINDTPVNLNILQSLAVYLIDIHSQHQNLRLNDKRYLLFIIDMFAGLDEEIKTYERLYSEYLKLNSDYRDMERELDENRSNLDYLQFQYNQLQEANLIEGEQEELEEELEQLNHAEEIKSVLAEVLTALKQGEANAEDLLRTGSSGLEKIIDYIKGNTDLLQRLESVYIELKDINSELEERFEKVDFDPGRYEFITERLDTIYTLQKKHHADSIESLIELRDQFLRKIQQVGDSDTDLSEIKKKLDEKYAEVRELAGRLTQSRTSASSVFEKEVNDSLESLGIVHGAFKVKIEKLPELTSSGQDIIRFMFSANDKSDLQDISKVASGGELSRLMLSIKSLIAGSTGLPTIIFDEIDTGVSGEIADKVGNIIKSMSAGMQVFCITHLPQVAAKGNNHFLVYKELIEQTTMTRVKLLNNDERLSEIAKMLSGEEVTSAAIQNAVEFLKANN